MPQRLRRKPRRRKYLRARRCGVCGQWAVYLFSDVEWCSNCGSVRFTRSTTWSTPILRKRWQRVVDAMLVLRNG